MSVCLLCPFQEIGYKNLEGVVFEAFYNSFSRQTIFDSTFLGMIKV